MHVPKLIPLTWHPFVLKTWKVTSRFQEDLLGASVLPTSKWQELIVSVFLTLGLK